MREAIGGTWLFQIVIVFVLIFTGFMCLSINYSKAFNVKNTIVKTIEREAIKENGKTLELTDSSSELIQKISTYLKEASYRTTGKCPADIKKNNQIVAHYYGYDRDGNLNSSNSAFCIAKVQVRSDEELPDMSYYRVVVFYQLDLPIFNEVFNFKVTGDTKVIDVSEGNS